MRSATFVTKPRCARLASLFASSSLVSSLLIGLPVTASAQESAVALPTINVDSPTGIPTPIDKIANSITVITGAELERDQRRTVPDALRTVPGLNVVQSGGPGGQTSVFMRGMEARHVKVLVDGIDISDPSTNVRTYDFGQLLTGDIERIEVLRGPQSGLYGSDAMGGVISITTKKGKGPPKVTGMVEGGSFGTFNQNASLSGSQAQDTGANVNYAFNVQHFRTTDTPVTPERIVPAGQRVISDYYDNKTYSTKLGVDFGDYVTLNQVARYTDSELRYGGGAPGNARQSTQNVHQFFSRSEAVVSTFDGRFKNYFGFNFSDHWNWNSFAGGAPTVNKGERYKVDWRGVAQIMQGQTLVLGLEHDRETLETSTTNAENGNKAGYVEMQSEFAQRVFLVTNIRHDINDRFGGHTTWRVAPAVIVPGTETKLKGSVGTGFKAPTLSQMFVNFPGFPPFFPAFFGNPNLKPETSVGYDTGFEQPLFNNRVRFGVTYFHNDIENLITANAAGTTNVNINKAKTSGVESFVAVTVTERLTLRADYTYTDAFDETTDQQLLRRPRNKGSVSAVWTPVDPLTLSATLVSVGRWKDVDRVTFARMDQGGYTTMNFAANYRVNENATVFGRIDNLFDARYENPNGYEQPGFGIFGGVRISN